MTESNMSTSAAVAYLKKNKGASLTAEKTQLVATNGGNNMIEIQHPGTEKNPKPSKNIMSIGQFQSAYKAQTWTTKEPLADIVEAVPDD